MFTKIALNRQLSRKTVGHVYRYMFDFGQGEHRVFWVGDRAFLETSCASDATLLKRQFPTMVDLELNTNANAFPW